MKNSIFEPLFHPANHRFLAGCIFAICLLSYGGHAYYMNFNADDVIQIQSVSNDSLTYLSQGRWGLYLIFHVVQGDNPGGLFSLGLAVVLMMMSGMVGARVLGIKSGAVMLFFTLFSAVSLYYGRLFSFQLTWVAFTFGVFLSVCGVYLAAIKAKWLPATVLLGLAPAFYQPTIEVAVVLFLGALIFQIGDVGARKIIRRAFYYVAIVVASSALYVVTTKISPYISGVPLNGRSSIDVIEALKSFGRICNLFVNQSIPFNAGKEDPYFPDIYRIILSISFFVYVFCFFICSKRRNASSLALFIVFSAIMVVAPYFLAFASPADTFSTRSLIAFSFVHAIYLIYPIQQWILASPERGGDGKALLAQSSLVLGFAFVLISSWQVAKLSFDNALASQQDLLAVNRIISRIDDVLQDSAMANESSICIAVNFNTPTSAGPRGFAGTARATPWSKEWIFRLVDNRFIPAELGKKEELLAQSASKPKWPARGSVYTDLGCVVVNVN
ncbi:glucosyltransferase domain-containing protein [Martelella mediterranea]|uniref:Glucosyl transferase GtrII n=1 Tax=Martelella mediterranea DSM 17316 TaxID=1122214 RepID=A0A1U9YZ39_9HYPH|nr:glucosyltransferase domain-containing protein [Martelella mediterranea]AQZ50694.1 hypothetical protein Mame_01327 [Martelella mediterranea DSM 17316]